VNWDTTASAPLLFFAITQLFLTVALCLHHTSIPLITTTSNTQFLSSRITRLIRISVVLPTTSGGNDGAFGEQTNVRVWYLGIGVLGKGWPVVMRVTWRTSRNIRGTHDSRLGNFSEASRQRNADRNICKESDEYTPQIFVPVTLNDIQTPLSCLL